MDTDAFILIGGRSSRFNTDKAFAEFAGETLAKRTARVVETALAPTQATLIAAAQGQFDTKLLSKLDPPVIFDLKPGFGAWSGVYTALCSARKEWLFLSACDHPFITPEFLRLLAAGTADKFEAVVPRQPDGRLQPLCAFYRARAALPTVERAIANGGRIPALTRIFDSLKTHIIEPEAYSSLENADKFFLNINTPDDMVSASLWRDKR
jgi:molybdopterin-guanine dinucleotide biosynthesis protein A